MATTAGEVSRDVQITVPARWLNAAAIAAFLATSNDEERPILYRTLCLEFFDSGVQVIGCDGAALFRTWVPAEDGAEWPGISEAPTRSVVVMDPDGFGLGHMRTLLRVTGEEAHANETLAISTAPADEEATIALGAEFMTERLTLRACGQRIDLRLFEDSYPDWRKFRLGVSPKERVDGLTVATRLFAMVGKLKSVGAVDLDFHGEKQHIAFTARGESEVRGFIMPMLRPPKKKAEE